MMGLLFLLVGCGRLSNKPENLDISTDFKEITVKGDYALKVPNYTTQNDELHDEASLEYANLLDEFYVIVIDEPKDALEGVIEQVHLENETGRLSDLLLQVQTSPIDGSYEILEATEPKQSTIDGLQATSKEMVSRVPDIDESIAYFTTCIDGTTNVYTIMGWTLAKQRDKYRDTFEKVANSFRLLKR
jgi:hypothetical protein